MSNYFDMLRREDLPQNHGAQRSLSPAPEAPAARVCAGFALCLTVENNNGEHIRSRVRCSLHGSVQCLQRVSTCFIAFQRARCFNTELFLRSLFVCDVSTCQSIFPSPVCAWSRSSAMAWQRSSSVAGRETRSRCSRAWHQS